MPARDAGALLCGREAALALGFTFSPTSSNSSRVGSKRLSDSSPVCGSSTTA
jgi:hypothetical protein